MTDADADLTGLQLPGRPLTAQNRDQWRSDVLGLFADHVYGRTPEVEVQVDSEVLEYQAAFGAGSRSRHELIITGDRGEHRVELMLCLPNIDQAAVFLGLNFHGNQAALGEWPLDLLLKSGFGVATVHASAIEPDRDGGAAQGIRSILPPGLDHWGTIGVWAWALSLLRRQLHQYAHVRTDAIVAIGHSRMGKTALWAAAQDEGFAAVISNQAGCCGDALHRHRTGEDIAAITERFGYWFTPDFARYADHEDDLPVDQHQLLASIAPRPVYVGSASSDTWADPLGQLQAVLAARALHSDLGPVGYHLRPGGHALTPEDWEHYLTFVRTHVDLS